MLQKVHFRLTSVAQKRCCLSSLLLSCALARTNVIVAGKYGSRRQSTTSFSENVVVAKTSDQMLEILII